MGAKFNMHIANFLCLHGLKGFFGNQLCKLETVYGDFLNHSVLWLFLALFMEQLTIALYSSRCVSKLQKFKNSDTNWRMFSLLLHLCITSSFPNNKTGVVLPKNACTYQGMRRNVH